MSKATTEIDKVISKIETVKKISDNPSDQINRLFSNNGNSKTISSNNIPKTDIFGEIIRISDAFISDPSLGFDGRDKKMIRFSKDSVKIALQSSQEIITDELGKFLTGSNSESCSGNKILLPNATTQMYPKEFDFMNILKVDPNSLSGKIVYEDSEVNNGKIKFNNKLFDTFSVSPYNFTSLNGNSLFTLQWNSNSQYYTVTNNSNQIEIITFLNNYYNSIEYPNVNDVIKSSMQLTIQSDTNTPIDFNKGLNCLEQITKKIFSYCNVLNSGTNVMKNNPTDVFNEDDIDIDKFFDFNDTEGIDLDGEDSRYRRVLKFKDCNNYEIPINSNHIEDFVFLNNFNDDSIINTLKKTSNEVTTDSDNNSYFISILNSFISYIPTALISLILSPKMLFPIVYIYKIINGVNNRDSKNDIQTLMRRLKTLFYSIISRIFKVFLIHFWKLIKIELVKFITKVASSILKNKIKRYKVILLALIALLTKLLSSDVNNCNEFFSLIGSTIDTAFSAPANIVVPGFLLGFSDSLPGYSSDRAYMNIIEKLNNNGIPTGQLYGENNDLPTLVKSIIDGNSEEIDSNSYIKVSNKKITIPTPAGPVIIPPGILNSAGKMF